MYLPGCLGLKLYFLLLKEENHLAIIEQTRSLQANISFLDLTSKFRVINRMCVFSKFFDFDFSLDMTLQV